MSLLIPMPPANSIPPPASAPASPFSGKAWQQVLSRDSSADGQFVYAVRSTGIFCRPSCPSRRPTRKNVSFFPTPDAAVAAGFRACLRCHPEEAAPRPDPQAGIVASVTAHIGRHLASPAAAHHLRLEEIARATGIPRLTILRAFKRVLGTTPAQYARAQRLAAFKGRLAPTARKPARVTDAIYDAGFSSSSRLYESSNETLGMTPSALRSGAPAQQIRYTIAPSPLGRTLVAATARGVCAIAFSTSDAVLRHDLRESFPKADLIEEPAAAISAPDPEDGSAAEQQTWLAEAVRFVLSQLTEHPTAATFPLDIRATAFQQRVWKALQAIPRGETIDYSGLAARLGQATATRAVASACGSNPVALAIPCHRVVGKNGALTGYRWGVERKRDILDAESRSVASGGAEPPASLS